MHGAALAHRAYVTEVFVNRQEIRLTMYQKAKLDVTRIPDFVQSYKGELKLVPGETPVFHYVDRKNKNSDSLIMLEKARTMLEQLGKLGAEGTGRKRGRLKSRRQEVAVMPDTDYGYALKMGRKRYQDALARGEYPYLPVLDNILANTDIVATVIWG